MRTVPENSGDPDKWTLLVPLTVFLVALGSIPTCFICFPVNLLQGKIVGVSV